MDAKGGKLEMFLSLGDVSALVGMAFQHPRQLSMSFARSLVRSLARSHEENEKKGDGEKMNGQGNGKEALPRARAGIRIFASGGV